jgi:alcohol dehydrogenase, propanol-preferring
MRAMVLNQICNLSVNKSPLVMAELSVPPIGLYELLVKVSVCSVCHTELDEIEGRTPPPSLPVILGHQVVGRIEKIYNKESKFNSGDRVGIAWINSACGKCGFCLEGKENLCSNFKATGRDVNGGYAEYMVANEDYTFKIPDKFTDAEAAPLLCAGAIGFRSLRLAKIMNGQHLGLTGFGGSGHLVMKLAKYLYPDSKVFVFARSKSEQAFALELGADWAGDTHDLPPEKMDAIIDTTPVWKPVVVALKNLKPDGRLVINAIRKEEIDKEYLMKLHYPEHLWMEKEIKSVANVTRYDVEEFLRIAAEIPILPEYQEYPLENANTALIELKERKIRGAKVLRIQ